MNSQWTRKYFFMIYLFEEPIFTTDLNLVRKNKLGHLIAEVFTTIICVRYSLDCIVHAVLSRQWQKNARGKSRSSGFSLVSIHARFAFYICKFPISLGITAPLPNEREINSPIDVFVRGNSVCDEVSVDFVVRFQWKLNDDAMNVGVGVQLIQLFKQLK